MKIAISGTHFMGKSTLIKDFIAKNPHYHSEAEPYDQLLEHQVMELSLVPSIDSLMVELDYSIKQLHQYQNKKNIILDRCPVDFLAYALCVLAQDDIDIHESEVSERFSEIKTTLNYLDIIVFIPITHDLDIEYTEENRLFRTQADKIFKRLYREDLYDIFPSYNHPKIVEISGDRITRLNLLQKIVLAGA